VTRTTEAWAGTGPASSTSIASSNDMFVRNSTYSPAFHGPAPFQPV
jgi:hypothetical protein